MSEAAPRPVLRVAVYEQVPWMKLSTDVNGTLTMKGTVSTILNTLANSLGFEYELVMSPDNLPGAPDANGSWSGVFGVLQRQEAEMSPAPLDMTYHGEEMCDFSFPLIIDNWAILTVRPTVQPVMAGFLMPFTLPVWLLTLVSLVTMMVVVARVAASEDGLYNTDGRDTFSKAALWGLQAFTQEGSQWLPRHDAGRVLVSTWLLASLVFMSSYGGILTAMLTVPRVTIPIDSLEDLVAQDDLPWRLAAGFSSFQYFKEAKDELKQKVFRGASGTFRNCYADRQAIADGQFAAICARMTIMTAMSRDVSTTGRCHLYMSKESVYSNSLVAMAFRRNSSYRAKADRIILALMESGIAQLWVKDHLPNANRCLRPPTADRSEGISPLSMEAMGGCFLVLAGGLYFATFAFSLEAVSSCFPSCVHG